MKANLLIVITKTVRSIVYYSWAEIASMKTVTGSLSQ
ncbi:hypothetical protein BN874_230026 [Candidatus Contendobacter odensis Run_B_J11]|uniref:Uncharacterized protein n=1 Tax=Candidatus Contendobacter odensis Run_B_J11 TaxID=1400861 RepID=A0A7U7J2S9_9GAMM|nr:hypothetical protein BN874_230026 [Candidatus Contendobacter odensis Run_B_J11]